MDDDCDKIGVPLELIGKPRKSRPVVVKTVKPATTENNPYSFNSHIDRLREKQKGFDKIASDLQKSLSECPNVLSVFCAGGIVTNANLFVVVKDKKHESIYKIPQMYSEVKVTVTEAAKYPYPEEQYEFFRFQG